MDDFEETFGVFTDNWLAARTFVAMSTQWLSGFSGPTGLNYVAIPIVMRLMGVPVSDRAGVFEDIRVMEQAALGEMRKK